MLSVAQSLLTCTAYCTNSKIFLTYVYFLLCHIFRSGKSSIQKVVFHKMSPNETLFLESTNKIVKDGILLIIVH